MSETFSRAAGATPAAGGTPEDITTLQDLYDHLKAAAQVELSTIPLYLYATYSIKTRGYSQWAAGSSAQRTMLGIAIEEMLHLTLARNVLAAVGGGEVNGKRFTFYDKDFIPKYPSNMAYRTPELPMHLRPVSVDQVENTFMQIELPEKHLMEMVGGIQPYDSLGQFYERIKKGIQYLSSDQVKPTEKINWQDAKDRLWKYQYKRAYWNQNGGSQGPLLVVDEQSALDALTVIVDQGEGAPGDQGLLPDPIFRTKAHPPEKIGHWQESHYAKFEKIKDGLNGIGVIVDDNGKQKYTIDSVEVVWPVMEDPNPGAEAVKSERVRDLMVLSNAIYCYVLALLDAIYTTPMEVVAGDEPFTQSERYKLERGFIAVMQGVLYPVCDLLVRTPLDPDHPNSQHAGPPFQYYRFGTTNPKGELVDLCGDLLQEFPELGGDDSVQRQISLLPDITIAAQPPVT